MWTQPECIILIDFSANQPSSHDTSSSSSSAIGVVETLSLRDIAAAAQAIVQTCVLGGSRLGGRWFIGGSGSETGLISMYVGRAPERNREKPLLPFSLVPAGSSDFMDWTMDLCGKAPF